MKSNYAILTMQKTINWLKESVTELRSEMADMSRACNVTVLLQMKQQWELDMSQKETGIQSLQQDLDIFKLEKIQMDEAIAETQLNVADIRKWQYDMGQKVASFEVSLIYKIIMVSFHIRVAASTRTIQLVKLIGKGFIAFNFKVYASLIVKEKINWLSSAFVLIAHLYLLNFLHRCSPWSSWKRMKSHRIMKVRKTITIKI